MGIRKPVLADIRQDPYTYSVTQNLRDAGCSEELVEQFLALEENNGVALQLQLLSAHRKRLLEDLHQAQRRIDCLDYLIYQMRRGGTS